VAQSNYSPNRTSDIFQVRGEQNISLAARGTSFQARDRISSLKSSKPLVEIIREEERGE
jgi:hypothetical protein